MDASLSTEGPGMLPVCCWICQLCLAGYELLVAGSEVELHGDVVLCEGLGPVFLRHVDDVCGGICLYFLDDVKALLAEVWRRLIWGSSYIIFFKDIFSVEKVVEEVRSVVRVCSSLQKGGNEASQSLVLGGMKSQAPMVWRAVEDCLCWLFKHVLVKPRFAGTQDSFCITYP